MLLLTPGPQVSANVSRRVIAWRLDSAPVMMPTQNGEIDISNSIDQARLSRVCEISKGGICSFPHILGPLQPAFKGFTNTTREAFGNVRLNMTWLITIHDIQSLEVEN
jgi:hypothetical protein